MHVPCVRSIIVRCATAVLLFDELLRVHVLLLCTVRTRKQVAEDLSYVVMLRRKFGYLESIPGVLLPHPSSAATSRLTNVSCSVRTYVPVLYTINQNGYKVGRQQRHVASL